MTERINAVVEFLGQGWVGSIIGIVSVVLAIVGIFVAIVLYIRSRIGSRLAYHQRNDGLIGGGKPVLPEEVQIFFSGQQVPRLTRTIFGIWNYGASTIHGSSIVADDPIRLVFSKSVLVLKPRVIAATRPANKLTVALRSEFPNEVICEFDYLDANDGGVIEILHTGEEERAVVLGSVRGVPKGVEDVGRTEHLRASGFNPKLMIAFVIFATIGITFEIGERAYYMFDRWPIFSSIGFVVILGTWIAGLRVLWAMKSRYPAQFREFF